MQQSSPDATTGQGAVAAGIRTARPAAAEAVDRAAEILDRLRLRRPRVHCITNTVAQTFSANMLLAAGAVPSMTIAPGEIAEFVGRSQALLVNLGTLDAQRRDAIGCAVDAANRKGTPWLLDPVFVEQSPLRADYARELVATRPAGIRLNPAEFAALAAASAEADMVAAYGRGVRSVIAVTGNVDWVTDGERLIRIENGDPLMGLVTAMGCAGSALVAATLAVEPDPFLAIVAGLIILGVAGEVAARSANGPGSLAVAILDAVYALEPRTLRAQAKLR